MPLAISSSSSMPVFWPSICHLSLSSPPCMSFSIPSPPPPSLNFSHSTSSLSLSLPECVVPFTVKPLERLKKRAHTSSSCVTPPHTAPSPPFFLCCLLIYVTCLHFIAFHRTHTAIHTKCWINSLSVPALRRWSFISGGCGKVTGWLPIIKTSSSEMTLSTVIDFSFFSHPTKDIQLADDYSAAVLLMVNSTRL